ncbi:Asp-tRNA(Asn)/Glu-tRNA(Gln) amidotransferase subunit GatB [Candidatus Woesearchaeota archaeon]|nr:Asp-tRNA(Asn)/Glu-tRNA(Gln) amidotransferase subunit GatB [Candidatus Woesearchaeota archaeon]
MTNTDSIIGIECHVSLNTNTKLFCGCPLIGSEEPNSRCCDVCIGAPGSKPVLNKKAMEYALKLCLALNCKVSNEVIFSRKTYFYPDMSKNYQITQYEIPIGYEGFLEVFGKKIRIRRIQLEEDPAALIHQGNTVLVDYNRSGNPLCEIVTEPDMTSPEEAREFLKRLLTILNYIKIFEIKNCIVKADANVNIKGCERVEIKNINGFKDIEKAIIYELERQRKLLKDGQAIKEKETRGWDSDKGITVFQRSKESEADYGYIVDPDLVPIDISKELVEKIKKELPELPPQKALRYQKEFKIRNEDAEVLANDYELTELLEAAVNRRIEPLFAAEWIRREVTRVLNYSKNELSKTFISKNLLDVLELIQNNKITRQTGQRLMELLIDKDLDVKIYVKENNLEAVSNIKELEDICKKVIKENEKAVKEYLAGNEKSFMFLVGNVMKYSKGKADPKIINELMKKIINL